MDAKLPSQWAYLGSWWNELFSPDISPKHGLGTLPGEKQQIYPCRMEGDDALLQNSISVEPFPHSA
jgi:hypothetical protein